MPRANRPTLPYEIAIQLTDLDEDMDDLLDIFERRGRSVQHRMDVYGAMAVGELQQMEDCPERTACFEAWVARIRKLAGIS